MPSKKIKNHDQLNDRKIAATLFALLILSGFGYAAYFLLRERPVNKTGKNSFSNETDANNDTVEFTLSPTTLSTAIFKSTSTSQSPLQKTKREKISQPSPPIIYKKINKNTDVNKSKSVCLTQLSPDGRYLFEPLSQVLEGVKEKLNPAIETYSIRTMGAVGSIRIQDRKSGELSWLVLGTKDRLQDYNIVLPLASVAEGKSVGPISVSEYQSSAAEIIVPIEVEKKILQSDEACYKKNESVSDLWGRVKGSEEPKKYNSICGIVGMGVDLKRDNKSKSQKDMLYDCDDPSMIYKVDETVDIKWTGLRMTEFIDAEDAGLDRIKPPIREIKFSGSCESRNHPFQPKRHHKFESSFFRNRDIRRHTPSKQNHRSSHKFSDRGA